MMNRILITGAQGFVGRYLTIALLNEFPDTEIMGIGRSNKSDDDFTHTIQIKGGIYIQAPLPAHLQVKSLNYQYRSINTSDQTELKELFKAFSPTVIIHLASGLKGDICSKLYDSNIRGTLNLLTACKSYLKDIPFIAISSGSVYGFHPRAENLPFQETLSCNPEDSYQLAKAAEETIVREFCGQFNIPWMILRVFNILGPGQDERHVCGRFVSELVSMKKGYKEPLLNVSSLTSERDFVDVRDVAYNIVQLLKRGRYNEVYNICSSRSVAIKNVLENCLDLIFEDRKKEVIITSADVGSGIEQIDKNIGDNRKLLEAGGRIDFDFITSIRDIMYYYNSLYDIQQDLVEVK